MKQIWKPTMTLTLPYHPKRYISQRMEALRRLIVLFFAALMAFSPVAVQAAACIHPEAVSAVHGDDVHAGHCGNSAKADHSIPTNDKHAAHCKTCCLAHSVGAPLGDALASGDVTSIAVRIGLPRDWAGVPEQAPNALLRPPRT
jgi:ABC-type nickel/cobalt efflux system permease component RcnA